MNFKNALHANLFCGFPQQSGWYFTGDKALTIVKIYPVIYDKSVIYIFMLYFSVILLSLWITPLSFS